MGRYNGLHGVGEDAGAAAAAGVLLAAAEADILAQAELGGHAVQALLADELGAQARHAALRQLRKAVIERVGDDHAQDAVAQELKPLVALAAAAPVLVRVGAVRQRVYEQGPVLKLIAKLGFYGFHQSAEAFST